MSVEYYLYCKTHNVVVDITDNKGNAPANREAWQTFEVLHASNAGHECEVQFLTEDQRNNLWNDNSALMAEYEPVYIYDGTERITRVDTGNYGIFEQDVGGRWRRVY